MLKIRKKREAQRSALAAERLSQVEASIQILGNEDLLDFADIFKDTASSPLAQYASAEMAKRGLSL